MPSSDPGADSSAEEGELKTRAVRRRPRSQPRSRSRSRPRSRSPPPDKRARYWAEREEPSGDRFPRGARYYGGAEPEERHVKPERRQVKADDALHTRTGGAYIPPARLRLLQAQITDKSSAAYQRIAWEALKKSIHGHINKINVGNIGIIIKQLLRENIVRGRGLLCRSIVQAQAASPTFTNVYAALVAAVNSRFPNVGELLLKRLIIQFKRGFKRNDKAICISAATFVAHLVNQRVAHEILALELLTLLVETPTDDSVEVAIAFLKECGQKLTEVSSKGVNAIFEMLRNILHEGQLDKRVQYMIEVIFQIWKDGFKDHAAVIDELELVPETEQFTHLMMLDEATDAQDLLNVFKFDEKYEENEQKYKELSKEILGSDAESGSEDGSGTGSGSEESSDGEEGDEDKPQPGVTIIDNTETNLIALRRTIYLTINSSLDFEECAHKLMKMQLKPGQEIELCHMFLDCCAEQRTYEKFYGLLAQRFCQINKIYIGPFEEIFRDSYSTAHRLDTNRLRNVSKFFAHLFFTDSISWEALECVKLNEEDTTSSSRIYIKILFQELAEYMGLKKLNDRLRDVTLQEAFQGLFPRDNPKNTRFSINFFTSIGLGGLTDDLREHLKQLPKTAPQTLTEINVTSSSSSSSSDSETSSSSDSSSSESEEGEDKSKKKKKTSKESKKNPKSASESEEEETSKKKKISKKSKKNKRKSATPEKEQEIGKENERWGHDGFYETYGSNAVRNPKKNDRTEYTQNKRSDGRQDRDTQNIRPEANVRDDSERPRNQENWDIRRDSSLRREIEPRQNYWAITRQTNMRDRDSGKERDKDWDIRRESSVRDRDSGRDRDKEWDIRREGSVRDKGTGRDWDIRREDIGRDRDSGREKGKDWDIRRAGSVRDSNTGRDRDWDITRADSIRDSDSGRDRDKDWDIRRGSSMRRDRDSSKDRETDRDNHHESSIRRERKNSGDGRENDNRKQGKETRSSKEKDDVDTRKELRKEKSVRDKKHVDIGQDNRKQGKEKRSSKEIDDVDTRKELRKEQSLRDKKHVDIGQHNRKQGKEKRSSKEKDDVDTRKELRKEQSIRDKKHVDIGQDNRKQGKEKRSSKEKDDVDTRKELRKEQSVREKKHVDIGQQTVKSKSDSSKERDKKKDRRPPVPSDWEKERRPRS